MRYHFDRVTDVRLEAVKLLPVFILLCLGHVPNLLREFLVCRFGIMMPIFISSLFPVSASRFLTQAMIFSCPSSISYAWTQIPLARFHPVHLS